MPNGTIESQSKYNIGSFYTDLTRTEKSALIYYLKQIHKHHPTTYLEIGVFHGGSFAYVLNKLEHQIKCIGVDLFEDWVGNGNNTHIDPTLSKDEMKRRLNKTGFTDFELHKGNSVDVLKELEPIVDGVVFIDGNHKPEACLADLEESLKVLKHGYILLHNASNNGEVDRDYIWEHDGGPYRIVEHAKIHMKKDLEFLSMWDRTAAFYRRRNNET